MTDRATSANDVSRLPAPSTQATGGSPGIEPATAATGVPDRPPTDVLDALDLAQRVLDDLRQNRVSLSLSTEGEGAHKRVRVELRHGAELVREIPPRHLLGLLADDTTA